MLYINEMTDKAVELAIEEVGKDSGNGGLIKTLYEEVKRLKGIQANAFKEKTGIPDIIEKAIIILEDNPDIRSVSDLVRMNGKEIAVELFKFAKGL